MPNTMELLATLREKPGPDHMRAIFDRYRALMGVGDVEGIVALFAEDATWEEPIGTLVERGREAISGALRGGPKPETAATSPWSRMARCGSPGIMPSASRPPR